jgi:hypothetical protein
LPDSKSRLRMSGFSHAPPCLAIFRRATCRGG